MNASLNSVILHYRIFQQFILDGFMAKPRTITTKIMNIAAFKIHKKVEVITLLKHLYTVIK